LRPLKAVKAKKSKNRKVKMEISRVKMETTR
jgi:hypothetical protein